MYSALGDALGTLGTVHLEGADLPHAYSTVTASSNNFPGRDSGDASPSSGAVEEEVLTLHDVLASHHEGGEEERKKLSDPEKQDDSLDDGNGAPIDPSPSLFSSASPRTQESPESSKFRPSPSLDPESNSPHKFNSIPPTPKSDGLGPEETVQPRTISSADTPTEGAWPNQGDKDFDMISLGSKPTPTIASPTATNSDLGSTDQAQGGGDADLGKPSPHHEENGGKVEESGQTGPPSSFDESENDDQITPRGEVSSAGGLNDVQAASPGGGGGGGGGRGEGDGTLHATNGPSNPADSSGMAPPPESPPPPPPGSNDVNAATSSPGTAQPDSADANQPTDGWPAGDVERVGAKVGKLENVSSSTEQNHGNISANNSAVGASANSEHESLSRVQGSSTQSQLPRNASVESENASAANTVAGNASNSTAPAVNGNGDSSNVVETNLDGPGGDGNQTASTGLECEAKNGTGNAPAAAATVGQNGTRTNGSSQNGNQTGETAPPGGRNGNQAASGGSYSGPGLMGSGIPLPAHQREKSVFLRLSKHIDDLETNMTLFSIFLDQISSKYVRT